MIFENMVVQQPDTHHQLASIPLDVALGASMAYGGKGRIYLIRANVTATLYAYDIATNAWVTLADAPDTIGQGGTLVYAGGDFLYATQGKATTTWYRYQISTDAWVSLATTPDTIGAGATSVWTGGDFIYLVRGGNAAGFYRYSIAGDAWVSLSPRTSNALSPTRLVYPGGNYLYMPNNVNNVTFSRYSIPDDAWVNLANLGANFVQAPTFYDGGDHIYSWRDSVNTLANNRYSISTDTWTAMANLPATPAAGCCGVVVGEYFYNRLNDQFFRRYRIPGKSTSQFSRVNNQGLYLSNPITLESGVPLRMPSGIGTDAAGANQQIQAGLGTGNAAPGYYTLRGGARSAVSGATIQTAVDRHLGGIVRVLTNNVAVAVINVTLANGSTAMGRIAYGISVQDGVDLQTEVGYVVFDGTNKAGVVSCQITKHDSQQTVSSGTLVVTFSITNANPAVISVNANSSLTPSSGYPRLTFELSNFGQQAVAIL